MASGRKSAFTIYDEEKYLKLKQYLLKTNQDGSRFIWNLIEDVLKKISDEENKNPNELSLSSFIPIIPPPRIIEDFEHVMRPYLNKTNEDEIHLIHDNAFKCYIYTSYFLEAAKMNVLSHEERRSREITFDRALRGLENLSFFPRHGFEYKPGDMR